MVGPLWTAQRSLTGARTHTHRGRASAPLVVWQIGFVKTTTQPWSRRPRHLVLGHWMRSGHRCRQAAETTSFALGHRTVAIVVRLYLVREPVAAGREPSALSALWRADAYPDGTDYTTTVLTEADVNYSVALLLLLKPVPGGSAAGASRHRGYGLEVRHAVMGGCRRRRTG